MTSVRHLRALDAALLHSLISGYTSTERYSLTSDLSRDHLRFEAALVPCDPPVIKAYPPPGPDEMTRHAALAAAGHVFGAFDGQAVVGLAIGEPTWWNRSMTLWEADVAVTHQRQGLGRALVRAMIDHARW
jgi:ribosomal protein S18 acetylase RimI-like enzyme